MGAFLEKPKTEKLTSYGEASGLRFGVSAMQGWRMEMEDAHVCVTDFRLKDHSFFGVFDGHAGSKVAQECSTHLLEMIMRNLGDECVNPNSEDLSTAIRDGFLALDKGMFGNELWASGDDRSGSTAITVMITPESIVWSNCGDSRGIFCRDGKLFFSTTDHKPYNESERTRIEKAGGSVMMQRVNGSLAVSRALGDFSFKRIPHIGPVEQLVSPEPENTILKRDADKDEFLLLACDGIYDVMSNEEVLEFVRHRLHLTDDLPQICSDLIDLCLNKNSRDNMSVILVTFKGAPKVSDEAIKKDKELQEEAMGEITKRLNELAATAQDNLDLEESYVIDHLVKELPAHYDVYGKRQLVADLLSELRKEKFGKDEYDNDFNGPSDSSEAPAGFQVVTLGPKSFYITPETAADSQPSMDSDPTTEGESVPRSSDNLPSPAQTDSAQHSSKNT